MKGRERLSDVTPLMRTKPMNSGAWCRRYGRTDRPPQPDLWSRWRASVALEYEQIADMGCKLVGVLPDSLAFRRITAAVLSIGGVWMLCA